MSMISTHGVNSWESSQSSTPADNSTGDPKTPSDSVEETVSAAPALTNPMAETFPAA